MYFRKKTKHDFMAYFCGYCLIGYKTINLINLDQFSNNFSEHEFGVRKLFSTALLDHQGWPFWVIDLRMSDLLLPR